MENGKQKSSSKKIFAIISGVIAVFCLCIVVATIVYPSKPSTTPNPSELPATNMPEPIQVSSPVPTP